MKNWFKNLLIPSGEKTTVIAYNSWVVRWRSANFEGGSSNLIHTTENCEIFPSEIDANKFAQSLEDARKLLKDEKFKVKVQSNQSKMTEMANSI